MLRQRLVVLMDPGEHEQLKAIAARGGTSVAEVVRQAIRRTLRASAASREDVDEAARYLCQEHDPGFDWVRVKRELEGRHAR